MSDTPNTDKLQELVESGVLDMPKAKQDTTKVKEAIHKLLDEFFEPDKKEKYVNDLENDILTLIDKYTREADRTFREGYEKALSDSNQARVETLSAWIHEDYIEGERLAKSINKKLGADELTEQKDGE